MNDSFKKYSSGLKAFAVADSLPLYLSKWVSAFFLITAASFLLLPTRADLPMQLEFWSFRIETLLWFSLSIASSVALYYNSFPQYSTNKTKYVASGIFIALVLMVVLGPAAHQENQSLLQELDLWRGRCGFLILAISLPHSYFMYRWASRGASSTPALSGIWASLSASSLGCFLMQYICTHHSSTHLVLWHFIPLMLMCLTGLFLGRKFLSW